MSYFQNVGRRKYGNRKVKIGDESFDSEAEYERYCQLRFLERGGVIQDLQRQVSFLLLPSQKDDDGKVIERPVKYVADFVYQEDGKTVVEDVKSPVTIDNPEYKLKRKMMLYFHGIKIKQILNTDL